MKFFKLDLLTLLISLFILAGCQKIDSIGLDVDPATDINASFTDTITVQTRTVREDSVATTNLAQFPFGYFNDPVFGKTFADIAALVSLETEGTKFGTLPALDSAVLVVYYGNEFVGDSTSYFDIRVHQLSSKLQSKTYYNNTPHLFQSSTIGSKLARFNRKDSVSVVELVDGKPDVVKKRIPHLRIPINGNFIRDNFFNSPATNFATNTAFQDHIKGLYLTVNPATTTRAGGIVFLNLADSSRLELYYKNTDGSVIDSNIMKFPVSTSKGLIAGSFRNDYSGTPVQTQLNNPTVEYDQSYVQGMGGLRTRVRFPHLEKLKSLGNITVNKAELVVTVDPAYPFKSASRLIMYRTDIAGIKQYIPDYGTNGAYSLSDVQFGGFYNSAKNRYTFEVTTYVQQIISGQLKQFDTYITPVSLNYDRSMGLSPSATTAGRSVFGSGKNGVNYKMKLNIIYSKIN